MNECIVGWGHSKFGKMDGLSLEQMIVDVSRQAVESAGISFSDIGAIYLGTFNSGLDAQDFPASLVLQASNDLRFKPATRVENACATGSAAVYQGLNALRAGNARFVLCVGAEKMTGLPTAELGQILLRASYRAQEVFPVGGFAAAWSALQDSYTQAFGEQDDALAMIAAKNHLNGVDNPYAHIRKDLGFDFCRNVSDKNPIVVGRLKRTDCSLVSDGAAAIVMTTEDIARTMPKAVRFRAAQHVSDYLPMSRRDMVQFEGPATAWARAYREASVSVNDLSFAEVHDCFTIAELLAYEAMQLKPKGQGGHAILEGLVKKDGKLPVNVTGGLKAKGHPIGATGVSMHAVAAMQLTGNAGGMQLRSPELAAVFNMGGSAVVSYVSILERLI